MEGPEPGAPSAISPPSCVPFPPISRTAASRAKEHMQVAVACSSAKSSSIRRMVWRYFLPCYSQIPSAVSSRI
jgi:hypothetical protein